MKHLLAAILALCLATGAKAQYHEEYGNKKTSHSAQKTTTAEYNEFADAEMTFADKWITFSSLPALPKPTWAIVTNAEGEFIKQSKVNTDNNSMDVKRLTDGLYFVTLVYKNKSKKAFTLRIGG